MRHSHNRTKLFLCAKALRIFKQSCEYTSAIVRLARDPETKANGCAGTRSCSGAERILSRVCGGVVDRNVAAEERLRDGSETVGDQGARAYGFKIRPDNLHNHVYHVQRRGRSSSGHQEPVTRHNKHNSFYGIHSFSCDSPCRGHCWWRLTGEVGLADHVSK